MSGYAQVRPRSSLFDCLVLHVSITVCCLGLLVVLVFSYENHGKPGQQNKCGRLAFSTT